MTAEQSCLSVSVADICRSVQDHFSSRPDMIDLLLKLVVNTDTRDSIYKAHSAHSLYKKLVKDYPDSFRVLSKAHLVMWFDFSGTQAEPEFPEANALFSESVHHGYNIKRTSLISFLNGAASPAVHDFASLPNELPHKKKRPPHSCSQAVPKKFKC